MIVFNALQTTLSGGIGRYCYELSKEVYCTREIDFKIVIREQDLPLFNFVNSSDLIIAKNINSSLQRNIYEQLILPRLVHKRYPNAIIHYPDTMAPLLSKNKVIITVHDLAFKSLKGIFTWKSNLWKNVVTDLSIRKATKIISITKFTNSEIFKYYPKISKEKIIVIHNGFNDFSTFSINSDNISSILKDYQDSYILTVSTISPRKNMNNLILSFNLIKDKVKENLIIAGGNGWLYEEVYSLVEELNLKDRVLFTGKVTDDELIYLYKNARLFTFLSTYEGFGLPPLEAMSFGIPCIVSNTSSLPEVVGDCAYKVNPYNIQIISEKMLDVIQGNYTISKNDVKNHLKSFSWKKCASEVLEMYKSFK